MKICRLGDKTTGHSGFPPTTNIQASTTVFINNKGVTRVGDPWANHSLPYPPIATHDSLSAQGSPNIFVENLAVARVSDETTCSDKIGEGSPDTNAN